MDQAQAMTLPELFLPIPCAYIAFLMSCGHAGVADGVGGWVKEKVCRPPAHGNGKDGGQAAEALPLCPIQSSRHSTQQCARA